MRLLLCLLFLLPGLACAATSNLAQTPRDTVSLISASNSPAATITLGLRFQLRPGWHIYWSNPGDAGVPPQVTLAPPGLAGAFAYPAPELLLQDQVAAYVLSGSFVLPFRAEHAGNRIRASASWLVCREICVPEHASFALALTSGPATEAPLFPAPVVASPFAARIAPDGSLGIAGLSKLQVATARFFPDQPGSIINRAPQPLSFSAAGLILHLALAPGFQQTQNLTGVLQLIDRSGAGEALHLDASPGPALVNPPLMLWLVLAFAGGLILNLMPCVFPILAMKALAITRIAGAAHAHIRREALGYTAGVLVAMLALGLCLIGLRALGDDFGWGFQFQSAIFVALIAWLILAIGLNLAGAFEISTQPGLLRHLARRGGFLSGLLAVITATPCTAPFMGGAIAAALAAPLAAALGIFLCLGLGLAAPFLLLAILPGLARILPRPGHWMLTLQRLLSLPMFATFLWLAWVEWHQSGQTGVALLTFGALCIAISLTSRLRPAAILALLILPFLHTSNKPPRLSLPNAQQFTPDRLDALRAANTPVFVDLTASWCVTCLVNDHTTLASPAVQRALTRHHIATLVGDWTNRDPAITRLLQSNNRDGVPLYLYYPSNAAPITLPQILTPQIVLNALK